MLNLNPKNIIIQFPFHSSCMGGVNFQGDKHMPPPFLDAFSCLIAFINTFQTSPPPSPYLSTISNTTSQNTNRRQNYKVIVSKTAYNSICPWHYLDKHAFVQNSTWSTSSLLRLLILENRSISNPFIFFFSQVRNTFVQCSYEHMHAYSFIYYFSTFT